MIRIGPLAACLLLLVAHASAGEVGLIVAIEPAGSPTGFEPHLVVGGAVTIRTTVTIPGGEARTNRMTIRCRFDDQEVPLSAAGGGLFVSAPHVLAGAGPQRVITQVFGPEYDEWLAQLRRHADLLRSQIRRLEETLAQLEDLPGRDEARRRALQAALAEKRETLERVESALETGPEPLAVSEVRLAVHPIPVVLSGAGQDGRPGERLARPLVAGLSSLDGTRLSLAGASLEWTTSGGALDSDLTLTDSAGAASNGLVLPGTTGSVTIVLYSAIDGARGPSASITANVIAETAPEIVLSIPLDGRTSVRQEALVDRGEGLLPLVVRVTDPEANERTLPLVPIAFEIAEGAGFFAPTGDLSTWTNGYGEAGIYFRPSREGRHVIRARAADQPSRSIEFELYASLPSLEVLDYDPGPAVAGSAMARPFRVRVTSPLTGAGLAGERVRFRVTPTVGSPVAFLAPEDALTRADGVTEVALVASTYSPNGHVRLDATLMGLRRPDGAELAESRTIEVITRWEWERRNGRQLPEVVDSLEFVTPPGVVGKANFRTQRPFVVTVLLAPGEDPSVPPTLTFRVVHGAGKLSPANVPGAVVTSSDPDGRFIEFTMPPASRRAGVHYTPADDDGPSIVAASRSTTLGQLTVHGAYSPSSVRFVGLDGRPLGGIQPVDLERIDPRVDGFLLEARMPFGYPAVLSGEAAAFDALGRPVEEMPEALAPVVAETELRPSSIALGSVTYRSSVTKPLVAVFDTRADPAEKPDLESDAFTPVQIPIHGSLEPRTTSSHNEGYRLNLVRVLLTREGGPFTVDLPFTWRTPRPILRKGFDLADGFLSTTYVLEAKEVDGALGYRWTFDAGRAGQMRLEPDIHTTMAVRFADAGEAGHTGREDDPVVVGIPETAENRRRDVHVLVEPMTVEAGRWVSMNVLPGDTPRIMLRVALRRSHLQDGESHPADDEALNRTYGKPELEPRFSTPATELDKNRIADQLGLVDEETGLRSSDVDFPPGARLRWVSLPGFNGYTVTSDLDGQYYADRDDGFVATRKKGYRDVIVTPPGVPNPPAFPGSRVFGVVFDKEMAFLSLDLGDLRSVLAHEEFHVRESEGYSMADLPAFESDPRYFTALQRQAISNFQACYRKLLEEGGDTLDETARARIADALLDEYDLFLRLSTHLGPYWQGFAFNADPPSYFLDEDFIVQFIQYYHQAVGSSYSPVRRTGDEVGPDGPIPCIPAQGLESKFDEYFDEIYALTRDASIKMGTLNVSGAPEVVGRIAHSYEQSQYLDMSSPFHIFKVER